MTKNSPPSLLHFEFWWYWRWWWWQRGGRGKKKGATNNNQQHRNLIVNLNNIHLLRGGGRGNGSPCPPPEKLHRNMGDGRATVQQDTLVSIGNRCRNTFHLHLHTGREEAEMRGFFWRLVLMEEDGGGEVKTESLYSSYKIKKTNSLWSKKGVFYRK